ncbi:Uncharacterized protein QTN25_006349 [Entamoeba marina]
MFFLLTFFSVLVSALCTLKNSLPHSGIIYYNDSSLYEENDCPQSGCDLDLSSLVFTTASFYLKGTYRTITFPTLLNALPKLLLDDINADEFVIGRLEIHLTPTSSSYHINNINSISPLSSLVAIGNPNQRIVSEFVTLTSFHSSLTLINTTLFINEFSTNPGFVITVDNSIINIDSPTKLDSTILTIWNNGKVFFKKEVEMNNCDVRVDNEQMINSPNINFIGLNSIIINKESPKCGKDFYLFDGTVNCEGILSVSADGIDLTGNVDEQFIVYQRCLLSSKYVVLNILLFGAVFFIVGVIIMAVLMKKRLCVVPRVTEEDSPLIQH